jgi:signal transduction histidine kinase
LYCVGYVGAKDVSCLKAYKEARSKLSSQLDDLNSVVGTDQTQRDCVKHAGDLIAQLISCTDRVTGEPPDSSANFVAANTSNVHAIFDNLVLARHNLLRREHVLYKTNEESQKNARDLLKNLVSFGIVFDLGIAGALLLAFSKGITGRLSLLSENAMRFARHEKLLPPMTGTDEVSELDKTFHQMAAEIEIANQRRQEFVAIISHDLRTPLTGAMGALELYRAEYEEILPDESQLLLDRADRNLGVILSLINELLDLEKMEAGMVVLDKTKSSLVEIIEGAVDVVSSVAEKKKVKISFPTQDLNFLCDADRLSRVLVNLLGNALKFSPSDSQIDISWKEVTASVEISIKDQGRGIPQDKLPLLFERFQQVSAEDSRRGTGLGLAICKAIVEAHGGTIGASSDGLDKGTTFWFRLPLSS